MFNVHIRDGGADGPPARTPQFWIVALLALVGVYRLERYAPGAGLDDSWAWVLQEIFARGWRYGPDIVFTYGPWGFLQYPFFHPGTHLATALAWIPLSFIAVRELYRAGGKTWWVAAQLFLAGIFPDALFVLLLNAILLNSYRDRAAQRLSFAALALIALIKFTYTAMILPLLALRAVAAICRGEKRWWLNLASFALAFIALEILAGQRLSDFPRYLRQSWDVAAGFTQAFAQSGPSSQWQNYLGLSALMLWAYAAAWLRSRDASRAAAVAQWLHVALVCFLLFKSAFVRHDVHAVQAVTAFFLVAVVLPWPRTTLRLRVARRLALLGFFILADQCAVTLTRQHLPSLAWRPLRIRAQQAWSLLRGETPARVAAQQIEIDNLRLRAQYGLVPLTGSVDLYTNNQRLILAGNYRYQPRPMFQSATAHTPDVARLNAEHLGEDSASAHPAKHLLYEPNTVRDRLPGLDDFTSWPAIASHYVRRNNLSPQLAHFERRANASSPLISWRTHPLSDFLALRWDEWQELPVAEAHTFLWAQAELPLTAMGKLREIIFKLPALPSIELETREGERLRYDLPRLMAAQAFPLSQVLRTTNDLACLPLSGSSPPCPTRGRVRRFRFVRNEFSDFVDAKAARWRLWSWRPDDSFKGDE